MHKEVLKWLNEQSVFIAKSYFRLRLESHPDYPSLLAIKDALEEIGITAYACSGTKEELTGKEFQIMAILSKRDKLLFLRLLRNIKIFKWPLNAGDDTNLGKKEFIFLY